ncbi:hypothetical protein COLO4_22800 [Corchorus olitorius]|uniref:Uncharacterized protein n=1 Tax=Corchorus olitorius TaxID=93759 RepID=A0A1R3IJR4_9ROSI|nr:hypothetical protein COLO4_22800 [Corchorus olitorius]
MASSLFNIPSSSSSSSSVYQTALDEGEDRDFLEVVTEISDLNQPSKGLGREVSRLILDNVKENEKLMSLKRRIEQVNEDENELNREIEELERRVLMLMLENGFKDDKLEKYGDKKQIEEYEDLKEKKLKRKFLDLMLEIGESNEKLRDLRIGIEETEKCEKVKVFNELRSDLGRKQVNVREFVSDKRDIVEKLEKISNVVDWSYGDVGNEITELNVSDDGEEEELLGEAGARELFKEIELLEMMLERGTFGLLDLKMMMEEVEAFNGPKNVASEMELKMEEMESGLCELKDAILELKGKKSKELMDWVAKEEDKESESEPEEEVNVRKHNWGSIAASIGAVVVAVAAAAMVFTGRARVKVAADKGKKNKNGKREASFIATKPTNFDDKLASNVYKPATLKGITHGGSGRWVKSCDSGQWWMKISDIAKRKTHGGSGRWVKSSDIARNAGFCLFIIIMGIGRR